jgi:hypothetical protein
MSSLLEQAIIDAKMIKEAAKKNAEAAILEHYAEEIKQNINTLLEADDALPELGADAASAPLAPMPSLDASAATPLSKSSQKTEDTIMDRIPPAYLGEDNNQEIELNLDSLVEKVSKLAHQPVEVTEQDKLPQDDVSTEVQAEGDSYEDVAEETLAEVFELDEEELTEGDKAVQASREEANAATLRMRAAQLRQQDAQEQDKEQKATGQASTMSGTEEGLYEEEFLELEEELHVDMDTEIPSGIQMNRGNIKKEQDVSKAILAQKEAEKRELEEAIVTLGTQFEALKKRLDTANENNATLAEGVEFLKGKINDLGVMNAKLLYTNKILRNSSLNERQKEGIVESISKATSVDEAKTICETLQKSAGSLITERKAPKSLTEALSKAPSPFLVRNQPAVDPATNRWQKLAGIKK